MIAIISLLLHAYWLLPDLTQTTNHSNLFIFSEILQLSLSVDYEATVMLFSYIIEKMLRNLLQFPCDCETGMVGLAPKWVRLAPNGTNPGLFQIRFQCIWRPRVKCTEIWSEKAPDLSHLEPIWPTLEPNLPSQLVFRLQSNVCSFLLFSLH